MMCFAHAKTSYLSEFINSKLQTSCSTILASSTLQIPFKSNTPKQFQYTNNTTPWIQVLLAFKQYIFLHQSNTQPKHKQYTRNFRLTSIDAKDFKLKGSNPPT